MAVFRVQKTQNYTIMSNHHLRNKALSLKAKGLLSLMLSLPEDWDYTTRGLASICKEGVDSVCATVRELEAAGYIIRRRIRDKNGQMRGMEYTVLEQPQPPEQGPEEAAPKCAQPKQAEPKREKPVQENPAQLNTKEIKKEETNNVSNPIRTADEREQYRDLIRENIEYDILAKNNPADRIRLDELVELMLDTVCSKRSSIRIAGDEFPTEVVKSRFLKLEAQHAGTTLCAIVRECAQADFHKDYTYNRQAYAAPSYCAAYMVAHRYGLDTAAFNFDRVVALYGNLGKEQQRGFLSDVNTVGGGLLRSLSRTLAVQTRELPAAEYAVAIPAKKQSRQRERG